MQVHRGEIVQSIHKLMTLCTVRTSRATVSLKENETWNTFKFLSIFKVQFSF